MDRPPSGRSRLYHETVPALGSGPLEQLAEHRRRPLRAVRRDCRARGRRRQLAQNRLGQHVRCRARVFEPVAGLAPVQAVGDVELLLEVLIEGEVNERPPQRRELQRGGAAALHHGQVAGGEVLVQPVHVAEHPGARRGLDRGRVHPRAAHQHEPGVRDPGADQRDRVGAQPQQGRPHASGANGADHQRLPAVPQPVAQRRPVRQIRRIERN